LKAAQNSIGVVQARTIAAGRVARSAAAEILSALVGQRRLNARVALESLLDLSQVGAFGIGLENTARSITALKELAYYFNHSESDATRQLHSLRSLRENFNELRALCDAEPGLIIPTVTIAALVPIAATKPATTKNEHGMLSVAVPA
jgi:hypothetical protein